MNRVWLSGNVGKDPEIRSTRDGKKVASFSLATSERWRDKATGERKEQVAWHNIVVFSEGLAGICEQYVKKGSKLNVVGSIKTRKWQDQSGADRYSTEIILQGFGDVIELLGEPGGNRAPPAGGEGDYGSTKSKEGAGPARHADLDDDVPFAPQVLG